MKFSEARQGRVFILRLEDGEIVHQVIEEFAVNHGSIKNRRIRQALCALL